MAFPRTPLRRLIDRLSLLSVAGSEETALCTCVTTTPQSGGEAPLMICLGLLLETGGSDLINSDLISLQRETDAAPGHARSFCVFE